MAYDVLNLDWETFCEANLMQIGAYKYLTHPTAEVLMGAYALNGGTVYHEDYTVAPYLSDYLREALNDPNVIIRAFNANFERLVIWVLLKINVPIERFRCTMVEAWGLSFAGGMADVGHQVGLSDEMAKTEGGKALINKFCKPAPKNHLVARYDRHNSPEKWAEFCGYNVQDVVAEMAIQRAIARYQWSEPQWEQWFLDQRINDRGLPVDVASTAGAVRIAADEKTRLIVELRKITNLDNPNSGPQLHGWLQSRGVTLPDLKAPTIAKFLANTAPDANSALVAEALGYTPPDLVREALLLKQVVSKTSVTKYASLLRSVLHTPKVPVVCGTFQFGGATRTKRHAGRLFQPHNMARPKISNPEDLAGILATGNATLVGALHGPVMPFLSSCIRSMIEAPKGKRLVVCDYGSIESRILGWTSGCVRINALFRDGLDSYKDFGSELFQIPYDAITKDQRDFSKPPTLGCGYGLGFKRLVEYAANMGVTMTLAEAKKAVKVFRKIYHEVPAMWYWLKDMTIHCVLTGESVEGYGITITRDEQFMFIQLPSGRKLAYHHPIVEMVVPPWDGDPPPQETLTYMGRNDKTRKWERQTTHGGKITENICQAVGWDILWEDVAHFDGMNSFDVRGHVHDEAIALVDNSFADEAVNYMETRMGIERTWAPGLLLKAKGFHTNRYTK